MQHDVLKIAVINRTRHKRTYHGFGVLELKDLLLADTRPTTSSTTVPRDAADGNNQVWSLSQSPRPSQLSERSNKNKSILNKRTIKVYVSCS